MTRILFGLAVMMFLLIASCDSNKPNPQNDSDNTTPAMGSEGAPCYPNGTCDDGLQCFSGRCVELPDSLTENEQMDEDAGIEEITADADETVDAVDTVDTEQPDVDMADEDLVDEDTYDDWVSDTTDIQPDPDIVDADNVVADEIITDADETVDTEQPDVDIADEDLVDEDTYDDWVPDTDAVADSMVLCTGQTKCYNATVEMTCPTEGNAFYGQDSQYAALGYCAPRSYSISGAANNDVVTDNVTGLIWQRTLPATYAGCSGGAPAGSTCTWQDAVDYCTELTYDGQTDWRLPTRKELAMLSDYGRYNPAIDTTIFPGTQLGYYWSSSSSAGNAVGAWRVSFANGGVSSNYRTDTYYARCVRGETLPDSTFTEETISGKVIVTDTVTGLIWTKEYSGTVTWQNALSYCENLNYGGQTDWRLPNIEELKTLVDDTISSPESTFPGMPSSYFWSSSSYAFHTDYAWLVGFDYGFVTDSYKTSKSYARCVRQ